MYVVLEPPVVVWEPQRATCPLGKNVRTVVEVEIALKRSFCRRWSRDTGLLIKEFEVTNFVSPKRKPENYFIPILVAW